MVQFGLAQLVLRPHVLDVEFWHYPSGIKVTSEGLRELDIRTIHRNTMQTRWEAFVS